MVHSRDALIPTEQTDRPVVGWQPIETAPRDGSKVDLWAIETRYDGKVELCRKPDCWWGAPYRDFMDRNPAPLPDQWCMDGDCYGDYTVDAVESEDSVWKIVATHWMPPPAPPPQPPAKRRMGMEPRQRRNAQC